jgi:replication factor C subunit 3/5
MQQNYTNIPWVEKYRPTEFNKIVLDSINRQIFENILSNKYFPNLLFYGPPGTGKTTTIINLINQYQKKCGESSKGNVIHLNASDERGIDIIRNNINQFVKSKGIFETGLKFVILDEVDYMTKNAQQALKYLLQSSSANVRFCLICNYISKIDESLKNEFISIRFNQLPIDEIFKFIRHVAENENISITDPIISTIQKLYHSDIRSMINFLQLHNSIENWDNYIITDSVFDSITSYLIKEPTPEIVQYIHDVSIKYNTDKRNILKNYFNYIIRNKPEYICQELLDIAEVVCNTNDMNIPYTFIYFIENLKLFYKKHETP